MIQISGQPSLLYFWDLKFELSVARLIIGFQNNSPHQSINTTQHTSHRIASHLNITQNITQQQNRTDSLLTSTQSPESNDNWKFCFISFFIRLNDYLTTWPLPDYYLTTWLLPTCTDSLPTFTGSLMTSSYSLLTPLNKLKLWLCSWQADTVHCSDSQRS